MRSHEFTPTLHANGTLVAWLKGVLIAIVAAIFLAAGAASFTHVHDWTMAHVPDGTPDWFGWSNAVISELVPIAIALYMQLARILGLPTGKYPMVVMVAAVAFSIAAQLAVAKPGATGALVSVTPAVAFLALSKLVLTVLKPGQNLAAQLTDVIAALATERAEARRLTAELATVRTAAEHATQLAADRATAAEHAEAHAAQLAAELHTAQAEAARLTAELATVGTAAEHAAQLAADRATAAQIAEARAAQLRAELDATTARRVAAAGRSAEQTAAEVAELLAAAEQAGQPKPKQTQLADMLGVSVRHLRRQLTLAAATFAPAAA